MRSLLICLSFLLIFPIIASAAESYLEKETQLNISAQRTADWIKSHGDAIREASGLDVLEDMGKGKFKVKRDSPKGTFIWIIQETTEKKKDGSYVFKSTLVKSIQGGIESSKSEIIVKDFRGRTNILIKSSAVVNNPKVKSPQMRIDMNVNLNRVRSLLEEAR